MRGSVRFALGLVLLLLLPACSKDVAPVRVIRISVPYELDSLDPHARNTLSNFAILSNFYEPLITTDSSMRIVPCLARLWENPDLNTWIFHLQPNARFQDGRPVLASDVVYTFERLMKGSEELEMKGYILNIMEVTAISPLSVRIRTSRPHEHPA